MKETVVLIISILIGVILIAMAVIMVVVSLKDGFDERKAEKIKQK